MQWQAALDFKILFIYLADVLEQQDTPKMHKKRTKECPHYDMYQNSFVLIYTIYLKQVICQ